MFKPEDEEQHPLGWGDVCEGWCQNVLLLCTYIDKLRNVMGKATEEEEKNPKKSKKKEGAENFFLCTADGKLLLQRCSWNQAQAQSRAEVILLPSPFPAKISSFPTPGADGKYELNFGLCYP